jgi:hypothetical protein
MREKGIKRGGFLFYGWYIIIASFFILFFTSGARYSIGVMFKPMISEFGWDRGSISLAFFVHMAVFAISVPFVGRFYAVMALNGYHHIDLRCCRQVKGWLLQPKTTMAANILLRGFAALALEGICPMLSALQQMVW